MSTSSENWRTRATCRDYNPEWWFTTGSDNKNRQRAQTICRTACPVREQCREWAVRNGIEYGIFGGETAKERNTRLRAEGHRRRVQPTQRRVSPVRA